MAAACAATKAFTSVVASTSVVFVTVLAARAAQAARRAISTAMGTARNGDRNRTEKRQLQKSAPLERLCSSRTFLIWRAVMVSWVEATVGHSGRR